jgi:hypothetical protein
MRYFVDADREKKTARIAVTANPDNLSPENLLKLEEKVKASLASGYLPCPVAWQIALESGVSRIAVGEVADRLGVRITDCRLGCFSVDKIPFANKMQPNIPGGLIEALETYKEKKRIDCPEVFALADKFDINPLSVSREAAARGLKVRGCQLGCF